MASHNVIPLRQTRSVADVLLDLRIAQLDCADADADAQRACLENDIIGEGEASDRMGAADDRIAELRAEFAALFLAATGAEWSRVERAIEEALL